MNRTVTAVLATTLSITLNIAPAAWAQQITETERLVSRIERTMGQKDARKASLNAVMELWQYAESNPDNALEDITAALLARGYTQSQIDRVLELQPRLQSALAISDSSKRTAAVDRILKDVDKLLPVETGSMSRPCWTFIVPAGAGTALLIAGLAKDKTALLVTGFVLAAGGVIVTKGLGC